MNQPSAKGNDGKESFTGSAYRQGGKLWIEFESQVTLMLEWNEVWLNLIVL